MDPKNLKIYTLHMRRDSDIGDKAISDSEAVRYYEEDEESDIDIRPAFFRDGDRIVHSKAYARYIDKTQVFFGINNANITHRSLHVILVARIARQIGRILKFNTDLIEAIALSHDVGHTPFGHLGEAILNDISLRNHMGVFNHNAQGIRWLSRLEKRFPEKPANGLNLTLQVLDGVICHDGEVNERELKPVLINGKSWEDHFKEYKESFNTNQVKRIPMSFEAIAVRFADSIAYIGRDIEDAILLKIIKRIDIPKKCRNTLGDTNRTIMKTLIMDLLNTSLHNDIIGYSEDIFEAFKELKKFNFDNIYSRRDMHKSEDSKNSYMEKLTKQFNLIFENSLRDLEEENFKAPIFKDHIEYIDDEKYTTYFEPNKQNGNLSLIARDFIAGMSDHYFRKVSSMYNTD
ncbi:MAG: dNTP triphosphohydrolase [Candidatus Lokiarchaeota archaeon]|nr:dNTP triphosphohydrolase [Candidatus Lokiarchaeota archaeon]